MTVLALLGVPLGVAVLLQRIRLTLRAERWQARRRIILRERCERGREDACWATHRTHTDTESLPDMVLEGPERREALSASHVIFWRGEQHIITASDRAHAKRILYGSIRPQAKWSEIR